MSAFHGKLLLIDNNSEFLDEVQKDSRLIAEYPLFVQKTINEGIKILEKQKGSIRAVIVSSTLFQTEADLLNFKNKMGEIPYIYVTHKENHLLRGHFNCDRNIMTPKSYKEVLDVIKPLINRRADWKQFEASKDEKFVELKLLDAEYVPMNLKDFMIFPQSYFNIYIKIGQGNYVKIVNAGDEGTKDIINRYSDKGIQQIFLPLKEHEKYLSLCERISSKSFSSPASSSNEKLRNTFRLGNEVVRNIQRLGIEPKSLDYAETFLDQSVSMIKNFRIKDGNLSKFIQDIENNEHSTAVSFLAGVIANELGFESLKSVKLVGIAALVHDIGFYDLAPDVDESKLTSTHDVMINHPKHGADLLRKSGCFDEVVSLAVEQHHMRRRGGEISLRSNNLNLVSEIVGVSDSFYNMVIKDGFDPKNLEFFLLIELKKFSHQIEKGVHKVLDKKRKAG